MYDAIKDFYFSYTLLTGNIDHVHVSSRLSFFTPTRNAQIITCYIRVFDQLIVQITRLP